MCIWMYIFFLRTIMFLSLKQPHIFCYFFSVVSIKFINKKKDKFNAIYQLGYIPLFLSNMFK